MIVNITVLFNPYWTAGAVHREEEEEDVSPPPKVLLPIRPTNISPLFPDVVKQKESGIKKEKKKEEECI